MNKSHPFAVVVIMNPLITLIICGSLASAQLSLGADKAAGNAPFTLTTKSGKVYEKARIMAADPDGIRIVHADGAAKVPFTEISEALQKEHGYDPAKAAEFKIEQDKEASIALANAVKQQKLQMEQEEAAYFRSLHLSILTSIQSLDYDYPKLDSIILSAIEQFDKGGKKDWVKILKEDRDALKQRELQRPSLELAKKTKEMEAQNQRLQQQIDQLRNQQVAAENTRRVSYFGNPFGTSMFYNPLPPVYIQPAPIVVRPPVCPPLRPTPYPGTVNTNGGFVPAGMQGGLDSTGGYTPAGARR
jgi:hypothetical protein